MARGGVRILAAVGPLPLPVLAAAVARSHRFRNRNKMLNSELAALLRVLGCTVDTQGRWHPAVGTVPSDRSRTIVTLAGGRNLTRQQMINILIAAGYSRNSATGRMSSSHPLFQRTGPDRYRLIANEPITKSPGEIDAKEGSAGG